MQVYLVGGAVRDQLLGRPVQERDWVVVGATPEQMLAQGYKPVGKDFPVFLHPQTHDEYALARTERKISKGYTGFSFYAAPNVTLEEDLKRRDLTINAMAQTKEGNIIDPYGGQQDLQKRILRHVSPAFAEDPVRILRVARFAARFHDFTVNSGTNQLMQHMVENGEVDALVPERVWQELSKALQETHTERFFEVLQDCNALAVLFPEFIPHFSLLSHLCKSVAKETQPLIKFAVIFSCLDLLTFQSLAEKYRIPREYRELAQLVIKYKTNYQSLLNVSAESLLDLLESLDVLRRPERFQYFSTACQLIASLHHCDSLLENKKANLLLSAAEKIRAVTVKKMEEELGLDSKKLSGLEIQKHLQQLRLKYLKELLNHENSK